MLWMVPVMFSAAQKALRSGNQVFISAGASVPGVFMEHHVHAVDGDLLDVLVDHAGGRDQARGARRTRLADGLVHVAERVAGEQHAVLEEEPPVHGVAGEDVLGDGVVQEALGAMI